MKSIDVAERKAEELYRRVKPHNINIMVVNIRYKTYITMCSWLLHVFPTSILLPPIVIT